MDFYKKKYLTKEPKEILYEKECKYVSLEAIINSCLRENNDKVIKNLIEEINTHVMDLQGIKQNTNKSDIQFNKKCDELITQFQDCLIKIANKNASENTLAALNKQQKYFENIADEAIKEKQINRLKKLLERIEGNVSVFNELPEVKNSKNIEKFKRFMEVKQNYDKLTEKINISIATERRIISSPVLLENAQPDKSKSNPTQKQNSPKPIQSVKSLINSCVLPSTKSSNLPQYKSQFEKELNNLQLRHVSSENNKGIYGKITKLRSSFDGEENKNTFTSKIDRQSKEESSFPIKKNENWCEISKESLEIEKFDQQAQANRSSSIQVAKLPSSILGHKSAISTNNFQRSSLNNDDVLITSNDLYSSTQPIENQENFTFNIFSRSSMDSEPIIMPDEKLTTKIFLNNIKDNDAMGYSRRKCILSTFKSNSFENDQIITDDIQEEKVFKEIRHNMNSLDKLLGNLFQIQRNNAKEKFMKMKQLQHQFCNIQRKFDEINTFTETINPLNEAKLFEKYWEEIKVIKIEINSFKGLMRDEEYVKIDKKLSKLFTEISEIRTTSNMNNMEKNKLLQNLNQMNDELRNRVLNNEEIMNFIFDEIVTLISFRHPVITAK